MLGNLLLLTGLGLKMTRDTLGIRKMVSYLGKKRSIAKRDHTKMLLLGMMERISLFLIAYRNNVLEPRGIGSSLKLFERLSNVNII